MKLLIIVAAITSAQAAKLDRVYLPPNARASAGTANFLQTSRYSSNVGEATSAITSGNGISTVNAYTQSAYSDVATRGQAALERNAAILRQDNSNDGETYSFAYETENGISAEESGVATNGVQAQGGYSYTSDDGIVYSVRYTADENGFVPQGDHLPTSPPIPEEILKEQNARDEATGIFDDGTYSEAKYTGNSKQYNSNALPLNYNRNTDAAVQKTYLPPSAQRNNYRRNGY